MEIVKLFLSIGVLIVAGFSVLQIIISSESRTYPLFERVALSYGLGLGCITFELLLFSVFGLPFDLMLITLPWIACFTIALFKMEKVNSLKPPQFLAKKPIFSDILLFIIILQVASVFLIALNKPIESYDAIINFGIKSKLFFLNNVISPDPSSFEGIGKGHMDYPLLIPLVETWVYKFLGVHNDCLVKIIFPLTFVSFLTAFYFSIKRLFSAKYAMLFTFLYCTIPMITNFATIGYGDLAFTYMVTMGFIFLFQYFKDRKNSFLILSAVFSGIGVLAKNEGIAFSISSFLIIAVFLFREKNRVQEIKKLIIYYVVPFVIVIFPWMYFKNLLGVHNTDIDISQITPARLMENAKQIPFILNKFQQEVFGPKKWNILWILLLSFVFLRFKKMKEAEGGRIGLFILFNVGIYFASYMLLTGKDLYFHVNTTLSRFMLHFTGIGIFLLSYLAYDDVKKILERD